jgi:hypothetical protein
MVFDERANRVRIFLMVVFSMLIVLTAMFGVKDQNSPGWQIYAYQAGTFKILAGPSIGKLVDRFASSPAPQIVNRPANLKNCQLLDVPTAWHVLAAFYADLTRDGASECALLVWRPWQDWPIMRWSDGSSPVVANRDLRGDSSHIILLKLSEIQGPHSVYQQLWAGSALALPILQIVAGDVDGDGGHELIALEGDYLTGRYGPARHIAVWRWSGFGFTLMWRSLPGRFVALGLSDLDKDDVFEILVKSTRL